MEKNSINKIILVGHLGANPLSKHTPQGKTSSSFSIATNETWKDRNGKQHDHVEWHNVVAWEQLADFANEYLYKGQLVYIEGSIRSRKWKDREKIERKVVEIFCSKITPLEWKSSNS